MRKIVAILSICFLSSLVSAEVLNGSFEEWDQQLPVSWNTIDSGISVSSSSSPSVSGTQSIKVSVNTRRQSRTDFRQSITVVAGQQYEFEVSVYHTEGNVRARLYVDGYREYSDPSLTEQWQTLSYLYTANTSQSIDVGLRFYDLSNFDGVEDVYLDHFQPGPGIIPPPPPPTGCIGQNVTINLLTDRYASETSWELNQTTPSTKSIATGENLNNSQQYSFEDCLEPGKYSFTINDTYGDGICCQYGVGNYSILIDDIETAAGGDFNRSETVSFSIEENTTGGGGPVLGDYYQSAIDLTGYALKTELHEIINDHTVRGYSALWGFFSSTEIDLYYEQDGSILDIYSENPLDNEAYIFTAVNDQCGSYAKEGDCYNREHTFPRNWFGGSIEPMNSDVHHIYLSDGYVNSKRSNLPFGDVVAATFVSTNGSFTGISNADTGYNGFVFEPIDEFKGDVARAHFYMATRYQSNIADWDNNSDTADAALNGSSSQVFENWYLNLLKLWHKLDPVSQKEIDRNNAAFEYQGNRNPFVDHPEFVDMIWGTD